VSALLASLQLTLDHTVRSAERVERLAASGWEIDFVDADGPVELYVAWRPFDSAAEARAATRAAGVDPRHLVVRHEVLAA
jgi:hypothetical protein